jgi:hypothetical protein
MLRRVALIRIDVSEERSSSIINVTRIGELRSVRRLLLTANVVPSSPILVTLMMEALGSSKTSVLTKTTLHNIPEAEFFIAIAVKTSNLTNPATLACNILLVIFN